MSRKLILASAITMALAGTDVSALGLGGLNPQSALNQPFAGEIELQGVRADEVDSVSASIASQDAFGKAGLERYYYLTRLTFTPAVNGQGNPVIRVSSKDPIREPYMDFLVEVVWPSGQLVKEYTILLDPPTFSGQSAPALRSARAGSATGGSGSSVAAASGRSGYLPAAAGDGFPVYVGPVGNGKGLWALSRDHMPADATIAQTAMALYRNNQSAFIRGDINRLIAGKTLVIPSRAELFALDASEAQAEYLAALRGRAQYRAPITDVASDSAALRLSGAAQPTSTPSRGTGSQTAAPAAQQDVMLALETSESTRQETVELRDRIRELETQLSDIQTLLQLRNAELARIQSTGATDSTAAETEEVAAAELPGESVSEEPVEATPEPVEAAPDEAAITPEPAEVSTEVVEATVATPDIGVIEQPGTLGGDEPAGETSETAEEEQSLEAALAQEEAETVDEPGLIPVPEATAPAIEIERTETIEEPVEPPPLVVKEPPEADSTWHSLLLPLAGLAGVTAVGIMAFSWLTMRRRREEEALDEDYGFGPDDERYDTLDVATEPRSSKDLRDNEAAGAGGAEPFSEPLSATTRDMDAESGVTMMSSLSNFDAETDEADVLSEADIYIAYGRYSEAQDLLKGELGRFPERTDIRFKLAESYAASRDPAGLETVLGEIKAAGGDAEDPGQWGRLQGLLSQLKSGAAPVAAAPGAVAGDIASAGTEDSLGLDSDDSFSLDISDVQRMSSRIEHVDDLSGGIDDEASAAHEAPKGRGPILDIGLGDSELEDHDSFGDAETVAVNQGPAEDSDIDLSLDEHKVEDVDDLDSIFDTDAIDEPTLIRDEMEGARPTDAEVGVGGATSATDSSEAGLHPEQESVPSDLLSSQWQIDSGIWDETATKLDLARAYIEMDDKDAAREILEEVINEGRDEQKTEAQSLLEGLA